jgi:hypothetical protein
MRLDLEKARRGRVVARAVVACAAGAVRIGAAAPPVELHEPRLLVEAPSEVVVGERVAFAVLLQEEWGVEGPWVPTAGVEGGARLEVATTDSLAELEPRLAIDRADRGRRRAEVVFRTPGLHHIVVDGAAGVSGRSNPVRVLPAAPAERVYWGDLHGHLHTPGAGHSGALEAGEYARIWAEGLAFARDASLLDFAAFTEHVQTAGGLAAKGPDGASPWDVALGAVEAAHAPGAFVTFPGFEWQGDEGDHCVIYPGPGPLEAPADFRALVTSVRTRGALLTAHAVYLPTTFEEAPPELCAIEVTRDSKSTEWLAKEAFARGVVRPFLGCSDTHGGALGATSLTGVRAPTLRREELLVAIRAGRTWATNGERIVLDFGVDADGDLPRITVRGVGTAPIDRVEIHRDGQLVAEARGFPAEREEFEFAWEDEDLLRPDGVAEPVAYHARVVQVSANRYDPGERDLAISSPVQIAPTPRNLDAAHARRGGRPETAPGAALELVREAWGRLRSAPGRSLRSPLRAGEALPAWSAADVAALRTAVLAVERLAARDTTLAPLARSLGVLPEMAAAVRRLAEVQERLRETIATSPPAPALLASLRADLEGTRVLAESANARAHAANRAALERAWFAPRVLAEVPTELATALADFAMLPERPRAVVVGLPEPVERLTVPVDPRIGAAVGAVEARAAELHVLHEKAWGYTTASTDPDIDRPAMRVRVVGEGSAESARLIGGGIAPGGFVPFEASHDGWVAVLDRAEVPAAGEPALEIVLDPPARVDRVFLEGPRGAPLPVVGRVTGLELERGSGVLQVAVRVEDAPVTAELYVPENGASREHVLWSGRIDVGARTLAFPAAALGDGAEPRLRWGFAGWRRMAAVEVPGHDVARALGFGALADGRAAIALEDSVVLVRPETGSVERVALPPGHRLGRGRQFCAAPCAGGTVLRGAAEDAGGWAMLLTTRGEWEPVAPGPEAGSVASDRGGGVAWLVGNELRRRAADGTEAAPAHLDAAGRLLAVDAAGRAVVQIPSGEVVREDPADGRIVGRVAGQTIGVDASGAPIVLEGLDRRHPEQATRATLVRHPGDGLASPAFPIALKAMPVGDSPLLAAAAPDGSLLVLSGTVGWRRGPDHDWWGVTVDRLEAIWVGEVASR